MNDPLTGTQLRDIPPSRSDASTTDGSGRPKPPANPRRNTWHVNTQPDLIYTHGAGDAGAAATKEQPMARRHSGSKSKPIVTQMDKARDLNRHGGKRKGRKR